MMGSANALVSCAPRASSGIADHTERNHRTLQETRRSILAKLSLRLGQEKCIRHLK
jgi:hypothetical protein